MASSSWLLLDVGVSVIAILMPSSAMVWVDEFIDIFDLMRGYGSGVDESRGNEEKKVEGRETF